MVAGVGSPSGSPTTDLVWCVPWPECPVSVLDDKPIVELATTVTDQDGTVVLDGTVLVWQEPLE